MPDSDDPGALPAYVAAADSGRAEPGNASPPAVATGSNGSNAGATVRQVGINHYKCDVVVVNEMGLHARPATMFVKLASEFACDVSIHKGNQQVDGKSILQLFSLAAEQGTTLVLEGRGSDAAAALEALADLVRAGFHEMEPGQ